MSAFFVVTVRVTNPGKFKEYAAQAGPTFAPFGGKMILKGVTDSALAGEADHDRVAIIGFPDMESLNAWHDSPEYQALIPIRDEGADITITSYSEPA